MADQPQKTEEKKIPQAKKLKDDIKHHWDYRPFRMKMFVTTVIVTWLFFSNLFIIGDITFAITAGSFHFKGFITNTLLFPFTVILPFAAVVASLLLLYLNPLQRIIDQLKKGEPLPPEEIEKGRRLVSRLNPFVFALNFAGAAVGIALNMKGELFSPALTIIVVGLYLSAAGLSAVFQINIHTVILEKPRRLLKIYKIDRESARRDFFSQYRSTLVTLFLALFITFLFSFVFINAMDRQGTYNQALEAIVKGNLSVDEARQEYQQSLAELELIAENPRDIPFPLDEEQGRDGGRLTRLILVLFIFSMLFVIFTQFFSAKAQKGQLKQVKQRIDEIAQGDADLTQRIIITQQDDVGYLADGFNAFMDKLQTLFKGVLQATDDVEQSSFTLNEVLSNTASATEQMVAAMAQITGNTQKHLAKVIETGDQLRGMVDSLDTISENVNTQATFVDQTSSAMTQMVSSIRSVSEATEKASKLAENLKSVTTEGNEAVDNSVEAVKRIEDSSHKVNEIVGDITEIADQTNLLAMNAAIEAAHAGEAGKGFAVVAEEIRSLAINSSDSANDITHHIQETIDRVMNGVKLSEEAGEALMRVAQDIKTTTGLVQEIASAMQEQNAGSNQILTAITSLVEATQDIRNTTDEQKSQNRAMRRSIERVVNVFREIQHSTEEMEGGNQEIVGGVTRLQDVSRDNQKVVQGLKDMLKGFQV